MGVGGAERVSCWGAGVLARRLQVLPPDNVFQFLGLYLSHLPLYEDSMEAVVVHRQLCDLLDLDAPAVLGKSMERAGDVVRIVGDVCKVRATHTRSTRPTSDRD